MLTRPGQLCFAKLCRLAPVFLTKEIEMIVSYITLTPEQLFVLFNVLEA